MASLLKTRQFYYKFLKSVCDNSRLYTWLCEFYENFLFMHNGYKKITIIQVELREFFKILQEYCDIDGFSGDKILNELLVYDNFHYKAPVKCNGVVILQPIKNITRIYRNNSVNYSISYNVIFYYNGKSVDLDVEIRFNNKDFKGFQLKLLKKGK